MTFRHCMLTAALLGAPLCAVAAPTLEELAEIVAAQQEEIEQLKRDAGSSGPGGTHLGGYGELHYNAVSEGTDEIDFHRFVLFIGHDFTPRLRFRSEFELEHSLAGDGKPGEVELEQAYIEYDVGGDLAARGGLMLVPVGILNETHEPPTFYGVERNRVENRIIPATWWEAGAAVGGRLGDSGVSFDLFLHSGLAIDITSSNPIRGGRQKVAEAVADKLAVTGRVRYQGIPGLDLAATVQYQDDMSQFSGDEVGAGLLVEAHAIVNRGPFSFRALYAQWDIAGDMPEAQGKDAPGGWYVEPGWRVLPSLGLFARYSAHEIVDGAEETNVNVGANYWPHPNVVLKVDYEQRENPDDSERNSINLGVGFQF